MKKPNRIIAAVCGIILIVTGFICLKAPISAYWDLGVLISIMLAVCGIADINLWLYGRKAGIRDVYSLATGILAFIICAIMIFMLCIHQISDSLLFLIDGLWIMTSGILRLVRAVDLHRTYPDPDEQPVGENWGWLLFTGILEIIIGVCTLVLPQYFVIQAGALLAILLIIAGINIDTAAVS